jgi:hypothetical protein
MSLRDFISKQFIDVIDWVEPEDGILAYRYPMQDREIQNGGKLTVRDSQMALFVNEGKAADAFAPGLYTLNTHTLPILTYLQNWDKAFQSPFKSDVYFFSTRIQTNQHWGILLGEWKPMRRWSRVPRLSESVCSRRPASWGRDIENPKNALVYWLGERKPVSGPTSDEGKGSEGDCP